MGRTRLIVPDQLRYARQSSHDGENGAETSPIVRKFRHGVRLTAADETVLVGLSKTTRRVERGDIQREGTQPRSIVMTLEGWLYRYKQLENGKRQITAVFIPGDLCEPFGAVAPLMDHSLAALTAGTVALVAPRDIRAAAQSSPRIEEALWWDLLLSEALGREHRVSLGRRLAMERLGFFFCEMHVRLTMIGMVDNGSFELPLTQIDLGDLFGLSAVHVNRSLQDLRGSGLLSFRGRRVTLHDLPALRSLSMFDPVCFEPMRQPFS